LSTKLITIEDKLSKLETESIKLESQIEVLTSELKKNNIALKKLNNKLVLEDAELKDEKLLSKKIEEYEELINEHWNNISETFKK